MTDQNCDKQSEFIQKSIEAYFLEHNIEDPDLKAKILPEITQIIYDRNMAVVGLEKASNEKDDYSCRQNIEEIEELETQINKIITDISLGS